jgi:putative zinc finger/helix-turn-helix YgiT family protein
MGADMKSKRKTRRQTTGPCPECRTQMRSAREQHRYPLTPSWSITIEDAEVLRCPKCGTSSPVIPKSDVLLRTVAREVIGKLACLTGAELAFLRGCLGLTGRKLAQAVGIAFETLSRYENGSLRVQPPVDRLVRMMVAAQVLDGGEGFGTDALARIVADSDPKPIRLAVTLDAKGIWRRTGA